MNSEYDMNVYAQAMPQAMAWVGQLEHIRYMIW